MFLLEPVLDRVEQPRLVDRAGGEAELLRGEPKHVVALDLGRHQADRVQPRPVDMGQQMRTRVDLPAPLSPVMVMKPSPWAKP